MFRSGHRSWILACEYLGHGDLHFLESLQILVCSQGIPALSVCFAMRRVPRSGHDPFNQLRAYAVTFDRKQMIRIALVDFIDAREIRPLVLMAGIACSKNIHT